MNTNQSFGALRRCLIFLISVVVLCSTYALAEASGIFKVFTTYESRLYIMAALSYMVLGSRRSLNDLIFKRQEKGDSDAI